MRARTSSTLTDDYLDYADAYRAAVSTLVGKCDPTTGTGGDVCLEDRDELMEGMAPLWGTGFYSDPIDLTGVAPTLLSANMPAVVNVGGDIRVFVATPTGLKYVVYDDPLGMTAPGIRDLAMDLPDTVGVSAFAVDSPDDANIINLLYVSTNPTGPNLHLARIERDTFTVTLDPTPGLASFRAANERPALTHDANGDWRVVFAEEATRELYQVRLGDSESVLVATDADNRGRTPSIVSGDFGKLLLYRTLGDDHVVGRRFVSCDVCDPTNAWGARHEIEHLDDVEGAWIEDKLSTVSLAPPTAILFPSTAPRLQVFTQVFTTAPEMFVRQTSFVAPEADSEEPYPQSTMSRGTESRSVPMMEGGRSGAAVTTWEHATLGEILLVYYVGPPALGLGDHLMVAYKRSD